MPCFITCQCLVFFLVRLQAVAIGQALLDAGFLETIAGQPKVFHDDFTLYKPSEVYSLTWWISIFFLRSEIWYLKQFRGEEWCKPLTINKMLFTSYRPPQWIHPKFLWQMLNQQNKVQSQSGWKLSKQIDPLMNVNYLCKLHLQNYMYW